MLKTFDSRSTARRIRRECGTRRAATLITLLVTACVAGTPAQEQHRKPTYPSGAEMPFAPLDPDEAAVARATVVHDFGSNDPALVIDNLTGIKIPAAGTTGIAAPYPLNINVSGFQGTVGRIIVRLHNFSHTYPTDVKVLLVGPLGQKVMLMSTVGGHMPVDGLDLSFEDGEPGISPNSLDNGTYAPTNNSSDDVLPPAPPPPYSTSLSVFVGTNPNGVWSLYVEDHAGGDVGTLAGFSLNISPQFSSTAPSTVIPDCPGGTCPPTSATSLESAINVAGFTAPIGRATVSFHITHPSANHLDISLIGPDNTTVPLVEDRGAAGAANFGTSCGNRTVFDDPAATPIGAAAAPFVGTFEPESPLRAFRAKTGAAVNGTWKLRITDDTAGYVGTLHCWSLTLSPDEESILHAPTGLRVSSVSGNEVTLRWRPPFARNPESYVLEGGLIPGETLASISTNGVAPIHTFVAPTGSFFVRVRPQAGSELGPPSNEIPLHVNVPVAPSPPGLLEGVANESELSLAWHNTFEGGAPSSLVLDVSGDFNGSIPLPLGERITYSGMPPGTYEVRLRAANDAGFSSPGLTAFSGYGPDVRPLKFTFPAACSGVPDVPSRFLAYNLGSTIYVVWEPPLIGRAATEYVLNVGGSFVGSYTTTTRALKGAVGPGTYNVSVAARNPCGMSAATPAQVVTVQ